MSAQKFGPEDHDREDGDCIAQIQDLQEQLNRLQAVDRRRRERFSSWPLQESRLMTSWRSTWKPNLLHKMASDPPDMNHPSDVLTIRRFVFDWLEFLLLCTVLVHRKRNALLGKSIKVNNLFNQVTTQTTHCAYAAQIHHDMVINLFNQVTIETTHCAYAT
jgi:hypothetical protein